jgi:outer membrane protein OmpA-like peptidoglycan-associated protein
MKSNKSIIIYVVLLINTAIFAQYGQQKKADNLFNKFSFANASEVYKNLIENDFNTDYSVRQLADSYAYMRNPDSAVVYYKKVVEQNNVPIEYYYKYAQALRGIKEYKESRIWLRKFKNAGGTIDKNKISKDADFITSIFNAKQHYFIENINYNSKYSDFGAYEFDGNIYFTSSRDEGVSSKHTYGWNNEPFLDIYVKPTNSNDSIVDHKSKLKGDVNSVFHDGPLVITNDGKTMYFSRNNYNKYGLSKDKKGISNLKIYKASFIDGKWVNIEELPFNSDEFSTGHPSLNSDNTKLFFASDMPGGQGGSDIYYVDINSDGSYGTPQNLGNIVNTDKNELFPFINNEGSLFFSSNGHQGLGLLDIFVTIVDKSNTITSVLNLGIPVNSSKDDFSFFMNSDGTKGYFASNRDGVIGSDDIYAYNRILPLKVQGIVTDSINNKPIENAKITLFDINNNEIAYLETDSNGYYEINIDRDSDYKIVGKQNKYIEGSKVFTSRNISKTTTSITANLSLSPVQDVIVLAELNTIYFDFEKYNIRQDAALELDKIVNMMINDYPNMVIRIESHTDSRGTIEFNDWLSQERAKATYDYLISKGIDSSRITKHEGFGERRLLNTCDGSFNCTEEQHQLNRRTEFIVIKMK